MKTRFRLILRIPLKADTCSNPYRTPFRACRTVVGAKRRSEGVINGCPTGVKVLPPVSCGFGAPPRGDDWIVNSRVPSRRLFGRAVSGGNGLSNSSSRSRRSLRVTDSPARPNRRASDCPTLIFMFRRRRFAFSHRFAFQFDPIGVVDQPIQDGIGHRGIGNNFVPLIERELAGNEGGSLALAVIEHLQELAVEFSWNTGNAEIVNYQQRGSGQLLEPLE